LLFISCTIYIFTTTTRPIAQASYRQSQWHQHTQQPPRCSSQRPPKTSRQSSANPRTMTSSTSRRCYTRSSTASSTTNSPSPVAGVQDDNLIGLLQLSTIYAAARGGAFVRPANPGPYDLAIPDDATPVVRNQMEAAHTVLINDFNTFEAAEEGIKAFLLANIDETWLKPLRDATTFYNNVTAYTMLEFLRTNSGGLHDVDLATLPSDMFSILRHRRRHTRVHPRTRAQP